MTPPGAVTLWRVLVGAMLLLAACSGSAAETVSPLPTRVEPTATPTPTPTPIPQVPVPPTSLPTQSTTAEPERFCWHPDDSDRRMFGDFDGDGNDDVLFVVESPEGALLDMCHSSGQPVVATVVGSPNKPASVHVVDVEQDGTHEVLVGAPTGSAPFVGNVWRTFGGAWRPDQEVVTVRPATEGPGETFLCVDADDDGSPELVPVMYRAENDELNWEAGPLSGSLDLVEQATEAWIFMSGTCGNTVTTPLATNPLSGLLVTADPSAGPGTVGRPEDIIGLGLHDEIIVERQGAELTAADGWLLDVEGYAQYAGPFSAFEMLASSGPLVIMTGPHDHCAGPPLNPPDGYESMTQLSVQPRGPSGCIDWFSVNLFVDPDLTLRAVTLEMFGP